MLALNSHFVSKSTKSTRKKNSFTTFLSHFILCFSIVVLGLFSMSVFGAVPFLPCRLYFSPVLLSFNSLSLFLGTFLGDRGRTVEASQTVIVASSGLDAHFHVQLHP